MNKKKWLLVASLLVFTAVSILLVKNHYNAENAQKSAEKIVTYSVSSAQAAYAMQFGISRIVAAVNEFPVLSPRKGGFAHKNGLRLIEKAVEVYSKAYKAFILTHKESLNEINDIDEGHYETYLAELNQAFNKLQRNAKDLLNISQDLFVTPRAFALKEEFRESEKNALIAVEKLIEHEKETHAFWVETAKQSIDNMKIDSFVFGGSIIIVLIAYSWFVGKALSAEEHARKQAEETNVELIRAKKSAEIANKAKSRFLANMSHEIRTPMNGVVGMLEVLAHSPLSTDDRKMVSTIRQSAHSLLSIINDILDFSKIEAGKLGLSESNILIEDEFDSVINLLDRVASEKGVSLSMYFDPAIPPLLFGDGLRLRQVLTNLTGNALKFCSGLDRVGCVNVRADLVEKEEGFVWVCFSISDNGIGIDPESKARLFKSFEQADGGTTRTHGGTGLGLVISKRLAEMMGGAISVESEANVGSTFIVRLPFALGEGDVEVDTSDLRLDNLDAVIVGDDTQFLKDCSVYLTHAGANIHSAEDMEKAWDLIKTNSSDEPVCVLVMGQSGLKAAQQVVARQMGRDAEKDIRYVVQLSYLSVAHGHRRKVRMLEDNVFEIDREALPRRALLNAVAQSVGREALISEEDQQAEQNIHLSAKLDQSFNATDHPILVAEDNKTNQDVIQRQLNLIGLSADICDDGYAALLRWQAGNYFLLLTDLHMPKMDGYELTQEIRRIEQEEGKGHLSIVALTANAMKGEEEHCISLGMDGYLSKPVELQKLRDEIVKYIPSDIQNTAAQGGEEEQAASDEPEVSDDSPVDPNALTPIIGDDPELHKEFLVSFVAQAKDIIDDIDQAYNSADTDQIGAMGHKLKSSSRTVGANKLADLCFELEKSGKAGDVDLIASLYPDLHLLFDAVAAYVEENT